MKPLLLLHPPFVLTMMVVVVVNWVGESDSSKILFISFISTKGEQLIYEPLLNKLAERGHEVTIVGPVVGARKIKNVRQFQTLDLDEVAKELKLPNMFEERIGESWSIFQTLTSILDSPFLFMASTTNYVCRKSYKLPVIQTILEDKWDVILFPPMFNECLYGLLYALNAPIVLMTPGAVTPWIASTFGSTSPSSFVPQAYPDFGHDMTHWQHIKNLISGFYNYFLLTFYYSPTMEKVYREMLDQNLPGIKEIESTSSIVLSNSHNSFTPPRPIMNDIIEVGGMHVKEPMPLPTDLDDFITGAGDDGFILVSFGTAVKGSTLPEKYRKIFFNTFSKLKQRVLWKWETEKMDQQMPKNIKLKKWIPQQDVLSQKNIKMFIYQGGVGSTQEAIYHRVPLIGIPLFGDQMFNVKEAERLGMAVALDLPDLTEEKLMDAINKILHETSYQEAATKMSDMFQDQVDDPLLRAGFWVEYVMRHHGAPNLRSVSRGFYTISYYSIDVILTMIVTLCLMGAFNFFMNTYAINRLYSLFNGRTTIPPTQQQSPRPSSTQRSPRKKRQ